jgi:hypothetical protein
MDEVYGRRVRQIEQRQKGELGACELRRLNAPIKHNWVVMAHSVHYRKIWGIVVGRFCLKRKEIMPTKFISGLHHEGLYWGGSMWWDVSLILCALL